MSASIATTRNHREMLETDEMAFRKRKQNIDSGAVIQARAMVQKALDNAQRNALVVSRPANGNFQRRTASVSTPLQPHLHARGRLGP